MNTQTLSLNKKLSRGLLGGTAATANYSTSPDIVRNPQNGIHLDGRRGTASNVPYSGTRVCP